VACGALSQPQQQKQDCKKCWKDYHIDFKALLLTQGLQNN